MQRCVLLAGLMLGSLMAHAQPIPQEVSTVPANSAAVAFPFRYSSVFTHYQPYQEQPLIPWREANDQVGQIGGWRFYAREAQVPDAEVTPTDSRSEPHPPQPAAPSVADPHSGHGRKP